MRRAEAAPSKLRSRAVQNLPETRNGSPRDWCVMWTPVGALGATRGWVGAVEPEAGGIDAVLDGGEADPVLDAVVLTQQCPVFPTFNGGVDVALVDVGCADGDFVVVVGAAGVGDDGDKLSAAVEDPGVAGGREVPAEPQLSWLAVVVDEILREGVVLFGHDGGPFRVLLTR